MIKACLKSAASQKQINAGALKESQSRWVIGSPENNIG
jgi:hypothetical protein